MQRRLPDWLRKDLSPGHEAGETDRLLKEMDLHTICESGRCPNRDECWSQKTATFMVMGDVCTRSCGFCSVKTGRPAALDPDEPRRVAEAARSMGLEHVVVTSVDRDELPDEGAGHFARVIEELKALSPEPIIEILTPDFKRTQGRAVETILAAGPDIFSHNVETVPGLHRRVRPQAEYAKSLAIFLEIKARSPRTLTKSGLMLGLGETEAELFGVLRDLRAAGCRMLTLGQYLQSDPAGLPVEAFIRPERFAFFKAEALRMGFWWVESAPFVRSSFHAKESFEAMKAYLGGREEIHAGS